MRRWKYSTVNKCPVSWHFFVKMVDIAPNRGYNEGTVKESYPIRGKQNELTYRQDGEKGNVMATLEFIKKRIAGKEKELDKLTKKLARIRKAEAAGWDRDNPYLYSESDLRWCLKDLEAAREALAKYQDDLKTATEKAESRNVAAILEFLDGWEKRCLEFYGSGLREAFDEKEKVRELGRKVGMYRWGTPEYETADAEYRASHKEYMERIRGKYEKRIEERGGRKYKVEVKVEDGDLEYIVPLMRGSYDESMERLQEDLTKEAAKKYDFIIERTNAIVGEIMDASGLSVGAKGDLNGYIIGKRGRAKVQTIGAGGYNIQCFHFRTLINAA